MAAFVSISPVASTAAIKNGSTCSFVPSTPVFQAARKPVVASTKSQVKMVVDEFNAMNLLAENPGWITAIANAFKVRLIDPSSDAYSRYFVVGQETKNLNK
mmetsp:Transcript_21936/g.37850  ORF Transcript_21936/g.37850 Transcript_21936/m.37850 type:complete len:101 (+) Transcript_21936:82-384(+)